MTEPLDQRKVSPVDRIVDSYRESLRTNFVSDSVPASGNVIRKDVLGSENKSQIDPLHARVKAELDAIRANFTTALSGYENELSRLQQAYAQSRHLIEKENRTLEELYRITATAETLKQLEAKCEALEANFQENHKKLQEQFESRQVELANYINDERKQFEESMFQKRKEWEHELDSLDVLLQRRKKEFEISTRELDKEISQKRRDWEREESVLEKEYHQRRLKFDQQMSEYESSFELKARAFREKELAAREEFVKKEQELQKKLGVLEQRRQKMDADLVAVQKEIKDRKVQENDAFVARKAALEKELDAYRSAFEKDLEEKKAAMMDDYLKKRDSVVDQQNREEKEKLNYQIAELKSRLKAQQKVLEDGQLEKSRQQDLFKREMEKSQKDMTVLSERFIAEKAKLETKVRENLEQEFYKKLQEVELIYTQEIAALKRENNILDTQLNQERSVIKRMESGLRHSDIHTEQIMISSIENQQKLPLYPTSVAQQRTQRIVRTSRLRETN